MSIEQKIKDSILYRLEAINKICQDNNIAMTARFEWKELDGDTKFFNSCVSGSNASSLQRLLSFITDEEKLNEYVKVIENSTKEKEVCQVLP